MANMMDTKEIKAFNSMDRVSLGENENPSVSSDSKSLGENVHSKKPVCIIVLGMAGSGKTTFVQRITAHIYAKNQFPYVVNIDPACREIPYPANIDIRDTVKYKEVMKQYGLGPNGSIITSLNLFTTKFDEVMKIIDKRSSEYEYVIFDTPGQIEVFTWSASGTIIMETLASSFPTIVVYVMDIVRSTNPVTFMSNMLCACSILYKTKLPFIVVLNKIDIQNHSFALEWMRDFTAFEAAIQNVKTYSSNLAQSMSLVLDEFYKNLRAVGVSSVTGAGIDEFFQATNEAALEYQEEYKNQYEKLKEEKRKDTKAQQDRELKKIAKDMTLRERVSDMLYKNVKSKPSSESDVYINMHHNEEINEDIDEDDEEEKKAYEEFKRDFLNKN